MSDVRSVYILIFCGDFENPGAAIGVTTVWQIVLHLPREQFADLLTLVASGRLARGDVLIEGLRRGNGTVRSAWFGTAPVPYDRDDDEELEDTEASP